MEAEESKAPDFFISYTGADQKWAEWIAWMLEEAGYRTLLQAWDFTPGSNFVLEMDDGAREARRTLLVLSPAYIKSGMCRAEWAAAFRDDPIGAKKRLLPVRVEEFHTDGLLGPIVYEDLVGKSEAKAKDALLKAAEGGRRKPNTAPGFPGAPSSSPASTGTKPPPRFPANRPTIWTVPYVRNPYFTGREEIFSRLHTALADGQAAAMSQAQTVHGLGGVGKTQVAVEYAYRYMSEYNAVLWVNADSAAGLAAGLAGLAGPKALGLPEATASEQEVQVDAVMTWLRTKENWLLVLDNVDSDDALNAVTSLLGQGFTGHLIVTSRRSNWGIGFAEIPLDVLSPADAVRFLVQRTSSSGLDSGSEVDASALARELGYLPLALEQAAAYIRKYRCNFRNYLDKLASQPKTLLEAASQGGTKYPRSLAETWLITEARLSPMSKAILRVLAFMAPEPVPRFLFGDEASLLRVARQLLASLGANEPPHSGMSVEDALAELADHSMISLSPDWVNCHRLVQAVQGDRLDASERKICCAAATKIVDMSLPGDADDVRGWPVWRTMGPHAMAVLAHAEKIHALGDAANLVAKLGTCLLVHDDFVRAEPLLRLAVALGEQNEGPNHPVVSTRLANLGSLLQTTGRLAEAKSVLEQALKITIAAYGEEHPQVATDLGNLAQVLQAMRRFAEAEPLLEQALAIDIAVHGEGHPAVAVDLCNLSGLFMATNRLEDAAVAVKRALAIDEATYGHDHPKVAVDLSNLAGVLVGKGQVDDAVQLFRRALEINLSIHGSDSLAVAGDQRNLGFVLALSKRYEEAEALNRSALSTYESLFGKDHPTVALRLDNLAYILISDGRLEGALPLLRRQLEILLAFNRVNGHEHPRQKAALGSLATALRGLGRSESEIKSELAELFNQQGVSSHTLPEA